MPPFRQARRAGSSPRAGMMSTFALGLMQVRRLGYGAMQLAGLCAFGPPPDQASARSDQPGSFRLQLVWPVQSAQLPPGPHSQY
jgi:hypothetical protein